MPEVTAPYEPGVPCWVDLMVPDQQAAIDFYRDLFGWQTEVGPPELGGYAICSRDGKAVAGIMSPMPEGDQPAPTVWTTYLATADIDATTRAITDQGGMVTLPGMEVAHRGRMGLAADPTGAMFGLWQAEEFIGAQVVNEPGAVVWSELETSDTEADAAFYRALGIETAPMEGAPGYYSLNVAGKAVGGMQSLDKMPAADSSHWLTYFAVDDTDGTVDALARSGGSVLVPPFDMVAGRMAVVRDPQGGTFAVIKPSPMETG